MPGTGPVRAVERLRGRLRAADNRNETVAYRNKNRYGVVAKLDRIEIPL
jgi:hypothetical protein